MNLFPASCPLAVANAVATIITVNITTAATTTITSCSSIVWKGSRGGGGGGGGGGGVHRDDPGLYLVDDRYTVRLLPSPHTAGVFCRHGTQTPDAGKKKAMLRE